MRKFITLESEIPVYLADIHNLRNYISKEEYYGFFKSKNIEELDRRINFYRDYNIGMSKFFLNSCINISTKKLTINNFIHSIIFSSIVRNGPHIPDRKFHNFTTLTEEDYIKLVINYEISSMFDKKNWFYRETSRGLRVLNSNFFTKLTLYYTYKLGKLDKKWII